MSRPDTEFDSLVRFAQQLAQQQLRDGAMPERSPALVAATQRAATLLERYAGRNAEMAELVRTVRLACEEGATGAGPRQTGRADATGAPAPANTSRDSPAV